MPNEHEIREKIHIATLELLEMAGQITTIHSDLLIRHFDDAKEGLRILLRQGAILLNQIPEEEGE